MAKYFYIDRSKWKHQKYFYKWGLSNEGSQYLYKVQIGQIILHEQAWGLKGPLFLHGQA